MAKRILVADVEAELQKWADARPTHTARLWWRQGRSTFFAEERYVLPSGKVVTSTLSSSLRDIQSRGTTDAASAVWRELTLHVSAQMDYLLRSRGAVRVARSVSHCYR